MNSISWLLLRSIALKQELNLKLISAIEAIAQTVSLTKDLLQSWFNLSADFFEKLQKSST